MVEFIVEHIVEIFFGLISAGTIGYAKYLYSRNKELQRMQREEQSRQYRQMIIDEIEPIIEELGRLKEEISVIDGNAKTALAQSQTKSECDHKQMYEDLHKV